MATERTTGGITKKKPAASRIKVPACQSCHSRKIKCNKTRPCLNCVRYGVPCASADNEEDEIAYPPAPNPVESSDLQALKDRIAQLENLIKASQNQGGFGASASASGGLSATPALSPDTPISSSERSEPVTPSTSSYSTEAREKAHNASARRESDFKVWDITIQPQHLTECAKLLKDELPPVKFFPKKEAQRYMRHFVGAAFMRTRYTYLDELMEAFNRAYPPNMLPTEAPTVAANALTLALYLALVAGMYPDSFKAFSAYLLVKPSLRLLWSNLSVQTLDMMLMEVSFLTTTGRLDEGYICAGAATRVAQALGLHVQSSSIYVGLDEISADKIRMIWWEVYCYDRWYALATGRPLSIRDKDCNAPMPDFTYRPSCTETPSWQPDFWRVKLRLAEISGKITSKLQKPAQKDLPSFYTTSCRNPFRPPPEHIGAKLNEEMNNLAKDLPPSLSNPIAHSPALYFALKFQSTKMMLFRSFLHHSDTTIRQQAQEEVFAAALTVTRLCYEGRSALIQLTCGTISMILLTCAVALASYSKAHRGKESARGIEAREAFDTLVTSLKCLDRSDVEGPINSLHIKNSEAVRKLRAFLDPGAVTPTPKSPAAPAKSHDDIGDHANIARAIFNPASNLGLSDEQAASISTGSMTMDTTPDSSATGSRYGSIASPGDASAMRPPMNQTPSYYNDPASKVANNQYYNQPPMNQGGDYAFYNPENYNPEMEFGHLVDPFSEAFFAELMNTNEQNMTPDDWSRLLA